MNDAPPDDVYSDLVSRARQARDEAEAFDIHALACALAISWTEAREQDRALTEMSGLSLADLAWLAEDYFPRVDPDVFGEVDAEPCGTEEATIRRLLLDSVRPEDRVGPLLAQVVARRALCRDHLWQDLGLRNRAELSRLLDTHFPTLARGNVHDMKWKKYFCRTICEADGSTICFAPSCEECPDYAMCFGEEDGVSKLMHRGQGRIAVVTLVEPAGSRTTSA